MSSICDKSCNEAWSPPLARTVGSIAVVVLSMLALATNAQFIDDTPECGTLDNNYGPFDYTNPAHRAEKLKVVEQFHFNAEVFRLQEGMTSTDPASDIDYTLRAFPNHHAALDAMARLHRQRNKEKLEKSTYSLTCYFDRAKRFAPHDPMVPMLWGTHLFKTGRISEAEVSYKAALLLAPDSAEIHYNIGLLYFSQHQYESARIHASRAYELGYPLPGLRNKLRSKGEWSNDLDEHLGDE